MPTQLCSEETCPNEARRRGRCIEHARSHEGQTRPTGYSIYRSKRWYVLARKVKFDEPMCRHCAAEGVDRVAVDVDHIVPLDQGGDPWSRANLQPLCKSHHSIKTRAERSAR